MGCRYETAWLASTVLLALGAAFGTAQAGAILDAGRALYAVDEAKKHRGSISVYDIDAGHRLIKTIRTVPNVRDVRGVAASAITGKLYVAYRDVSGIGRVYCLDVDSDRLLWDKSIAPGVDRLAINPNGRLLYVPTWEDGTADFINVVDAGTGNILRRVYFSNRSHDTQYPRFGPVFQETKAEDGSGNYLYMVDPKSYEISRLGPYSGVLGPYAVDGASRYVVNDVTHLWGMQVANVETGEIVTARLPGHAPGDLWLLHGIGWTPGEREVWQTSTASDPHVYVWDMRNPMAPVLKQRLRLKSGRGSHWLTFTVRGDYAYVAPEKNSDDATEVFAVPNHASVGTIGASEDMLEIDFANGRVSRVGDQFGIGRR
jgi:6-phosphogluconolactonase (cycloisomerase 2 family)